MKKILLSILIAFSFNSYAQLTYVPDDVFENHLETNGMGNGIINDDYVTTANITEVTNLDISLFALQNAIADLTGIEDFVALTDLNCNSQYLLTSISLTQNSALEYLDVSECSLTSLDVSLMPNLFSLNCYGCSLTSLDLSQNPTLNNLYCQTNSISTLDLSENGALQNLDCWSNDLTSLTLPQSPSLLYDLNCNGNLLTSLDFNQGYPYLNYVECGGNQLTNLNLSQCPGLSELGCNYNNLTSLNVSQNLALSILHCTNNQLTYFDVSQDTLLSVLYCDQNQLTSLDVTQNRALLGLSCSHNQLISLNVFEDTLLVNLWASHNQLTELNVSNNSDLILLAVNNNNLNCLNVQNGNNGSAATNLWWVGAKFNPNLVCIQVDNVFWANNNWVTGPTGNIDPGVVFSLNCPNSCDISVGITELEVWPKELLLYPNPTDGNFTIDLGVNYESATVRVTDIYGKLIQSYSYNDHQLLDIKIEEPAGVYLLMLESGDKKSVIRIVKE